MELTATCDKATIVNLTQHAYFNLDGSPDVLDHELMLACDFFTPSDADLIPTGEILSVEGAPFDFRKGARHPQSLGPDLRHQFRRCRARAARTVWRGSRRCARPRTALTLELHSTEPGVQVYDAAKFNCPVPGLDGALYGPHAGLCMEPQAFPDSPNRRHFTDCVLRTDEEYHHVSEFRFR